MKRLSLLRHAKSDAGEADIPDFERPLNRKGERAARAIGRHLAERAQHFDLVIASPATRVTETLAQVADGLGRKLAPRWDPRLYLASSAALLDIVRATDAAVEHLLLVGHNPGLEELIFDLVPPDGSSPLRGRVEEKFPTAAFATMVSGVDGWAKFGESGVRLVSLVMPRDLDPSLGPNKG